MANSPGVSDVEKKEKVFMYSKVSLSLENSILPPEKLLLSPSESDGLDRETETHLRILGCELIQTSGVLLRLPQVAMATGQVLFQRFYYSKSFVRHPMEVVAMACVTLASKIEEAPRRIRDVINVFHHIKQVKAGKTMQPLILDQNYINLKNQVIKAERRVLKELGFCVHVQHPHKIIVTLLEVLKVNNRKLLQTAWNYMNDSLRSEVFIRYHPETIACACIYLSARVLQIPLPNKPPWFLIFDVCEEDIHNICHIILMLYTMRKPDPEKLEKTVEEVKKIHQEAKLKAKGIANANSLLSNHHSFSPTSNPSSPKNSKSPPVDVKKEKEEPKPNNGITPKESNHKKRRSMSPVEDDPVSPRRKKKSKTSSSGSQSSRSPSPRHKHGKTPPRGYKESRRSRSRSHSKTRESKKSKHRSSHKSHKRSRSHSDSASPPPRKHSSKKSYKTKSSKSRHVSKSPPRIYEHNHHHHTNSHEKSHKSRKEKSSHHSKEKSRR